MNYFRHAPVGRLTNGNHEASVLTVQAVLPDGVTEPARDLAEAMKFHMELSHSSGTTTVVLDVKGSPFPSYVTEAVKSLVAIGMGLVVLHDKQCTLDVGNALPTDLREAVAKAGRGGVVIDPRNGDLVYMLGA